MKVELAVRVRIGGLLCAASRSGLISGNAVEKQKVAKNVLALVRLSVIKELIFYLWFGKNIVKK